MMSFRFGMNTLSVDGEGLSGAVRFDYDIPFLSSDPRQVPRTYPAISQITLALPFLWMVPEFDRRSSGIRTDESRNRAPHPSPRS